MEINIGSIVLEDELNFGNIKLDTVKVYPELENIEITPSKEEQIFKSQDYYGYDEVKVAGITNSIDENIKSENIKKDISILGVTGNVEEINTTEISINPTSEEQTIVPEEPYNGFSKVIVRAQSGVDINDYFETTVTSSNINNFGTNTLIKKTPNIKIDQSVTNLQYLFYNAYYLKSLNLIIDDNKELDCYYAFYNCTNLREVKGLEKTKITNAQQMFYNCQNLVDIPDMDTSLCKNFSYAFNNCRSITTINNINTINATRMEYSFSYCYKLEEVYNLDTSNVTNFTYMFYYCEILTTIDKLNAKSCESIYNMFQGCRKLTNLGGLENLGQAYSTAKNANYSSYTLDLSNSLNLTHNSLMNVINNLYDIASAGVKPQKLQLGSTNLEKLNATEEGQQAIASAQAKGWTVS